MTTGELIKKRRLALGMTQKQLGEKCGIADSAVRKYESGKVKPKLEMLDRLANALECHPGNLVPYKIFSDHRTYESASDFDLAWKAAAERIQQQDGMDDNEYTQLVWSSAVKSLKVLDDRVFIENLSEPALKLNVDGRNVLLRVAEEMAEDDNLTKVNGNETEKEI